ncbi:FtsK/SpoIIIE domain-containing protein [Cellulomonas cellasea]|uniref:S-DNA-T family DNA segregation ATPase FtsK/SpoIIIE n=1 Tax=Cellulomonas cellasea TaxID=43670 RepID=A0A7W4YBL8_9CELL|nr:FtsK/SpoIIIE domain-containing protein [Cellulomonas cellasea]MBB2922867.1 S-DNA-T family DNA segregation ATPase FtsK/SpoIIIE [Cellulomonas cellasea]
MRLLLQPTGSAPATEVDVPPGTRARDLRTGLGRLTGDPRWSAPGARLAAGPVAVDDEHPCGRYPLLAGAELRLSRGPTPPDVTALHARFHVAVLAGPDCGALAAVAPELVVGRAAGPAGGASLRVEDPALSRAHVRLLARRRHVLARDLRTSNGTLVARADRRGVPREHLAVGADGGARRARVRPLGRRAVRLRTGDRLHVGTSVLEVRGPLRPRDRPLADADAPGAGPGAWLWLGPAVGSAALAVSTGNPVLLVGVLLGPVMMLAHAGRTRARRRRAGAPGGSQALAGRRGRRGRPGEASDATSPGADDAPLGPADLTAASVLAAVPGVPSTTTPSAGGGLRRLGHAAVHEQGLVVAVTGRRSLALGTARALALALAGPTGDGALVVRCDDERRADWRWARWLAKVPAATPVTPRARCVVVVDGPVTLAGTRGGDGRPGTALVLVADGPGAVPAWCTSVLTVGADGATLRTGGSHRPLPLQAVTVAWAEAQARRVAGARAGGAAGGGSGVGGSGVDGSGVGAAGFRGSGGGGSGGGATGLGVSPPFTASSVPGTRPPQVPRAQGVASRTGAGSPHGEDPLPRTVGLGDLPGVPAPDAAAVAARWAEPAPPGLRAALGVDHTGPVHVDLVADGPHALVAGTTGAGKSGLLQTLVLTLALAHPPERLAVALVDYKGGTSFGPIARLPHVVGQVTDLDGALAERALAGLRAELHRRERVLAEAGVADVDALAAEHRAGRTTVSPLPRLLVVVDEFRALADEVPTFVPGLLRVAAQGRALGMHLVLATQRPAGAVGPDLRANIALRVALRVADAAESTDVLGVGDAAALPVDRPGRAVLRRGNRAPEQLQVALPHGPRRDEVVRLADPWLAGAPSWVPTGPDPAREDGSSRYVDAVRAAAHGRPAPVSPWLPELPVLVTRDEVHAQVTGAAAPGPGDVPLGLGDVPAEQRRSLVSWRPDDGHLLVRGGPGSGRTSTLRTVVHRALELGWDVHAVGFAADGLPAPAELLGTVVGPDDPRRLARLVRLLAGRRSRTAAEGDGARSEDVPQLLVVDGLESTVAALDGVARGAATELLVDLLRDGRARRVAVAAGCGSGAGLASLVGHFRSRLVLGPGDPVTDVLAGVPTALAGGRRPPGRAVHVGPEGAVLCQVALTDGPPRTSRGAGHQPLRLAPVPARVTLDAPGAVHVDGPAADRVALGRGGDAAEVLSLDVRRGALVVGPPGSGRTTALAVVAAALVGVGRDVAVVADDAPLTAVPGVRWSAGSRDLADLLGHLEGATGPVDVVVDDLDALESSAPHLVERLVGWLERARAAHHAGLRPGHPTPAGGTPVPRAPGSRVVASSSTARAATAYREPLASLRHARSGIVLQPHEPGSADVFGTAVEWALDPAQPHLAGRGVVVTGRDAVPLQVALPVLVDRA